MNISLPHLANGGSNNRPFYLTSFTCRAHQILKMGYDRLVGSSFCDSEEEDITGELVKTMREAVEDRSAPRWTRSFWISEEIPVNGLKNRGKRRRKIDIEIVASGAGVRPKFRFEAKRLKDSKSRLKYLGKDGLGRFLAGSYAPESVVVGMVGYVQALTTAHHSKSLASTLHKNPVRYRLRPDGHWTEVRIVADLSTFRTAHDRTIPLPSVMVVHTFLRFC
jgi:hypothetical protein